MVTSALGLVDGDSIVNALSELSPLASSARLGTRSPLAPLGPFRTGLMITFLNDV